MGEIAEMMLDGTLCERCGGVVDGTTPGYPRLCSDCSYEDKFDGITPEDFNHSIRCIKYFANEIIDEGDTRQRKKLRNVCSRIMNKVKEKNKCIV